MKKYLVFLVGVMLAPFARADYTIVVPQEKVEVICGGFSDVYPRSLHYDGILLIGPNHYFDVPAEARYFVKGDCPSLRDHVASLYGQDLYLNVSGKVIYLSDGDWGKTPGDPLQQPQQQQPVNQNQDNSQDSTNYQR